MKQYGWLVVLLLFLLALAAVLMSPLGASAEEPAPPPKIQLASEGWVWAASYWSESTERRDLAGGRFQAQATGQHWIAAVRADATGLPGEFQPDKYSTFRAVAFGAMAGWRVACVDRICVSPSVAAEYAVSLEKQDGKLPTMPRSFTAGLGAHVAGPGWWGVVVVGQAQALRGIAATATWQVRLTDRTASIGQISIGGGGQGTPLYVISTGVAVRWK